MGRNENKYEDEGLTRRGFLRVLGGGALLGAGAIAAKKYGYDRFFNESTEEAENSVPKNGEVLDEASRKRIEEIRDLETKTVFESLNIKTFEDLAKPIEINKKTYEATCQIWEQRYLKEKKQDLINAYEAFRFFRGHIRREVRNELKGVPAADESFVEFVSDYLPIAESDGYFKKPSKAGAMGPFQIMGGTQGLLLKRMAEEGVSATVLTRYRTAGGYDPKRDPVMSATLAGKCFKDLLVRLKDKDLAVSGYNGNYVNDYKRRRIKEGKGDQLSYEDFLSYAKDDINAYRIQVFDQQKTSIPFRARKGDTWESIGKYAGVSADELKKANQNKKELKPKDEIAIPLLTPEVRLRMMRNYVSGYIENLTYPAKIHGLKAAAEKLQLKQQFPDRSVQWQEIRVQDKAMMVVVKKGDTLNGIVARIKKTPGVDPDSVTIEAVKRANGLTSDKVKINQQLKILGRSLPNRLTSIASRQEDLETLRFLNPAIEEDDAPFPAGTSIRIPAGDRATIREGVRAHKKIEEL